MSRKTAFPCIPSRHSIHSRRGPPEIIKERILKGHQVLPKGRRRLSRLRIPNGEAREEKMVDPFYPKRIGCTVNIPYVFGKKAPVASFNVKKPKPPFLLRHADILPSN
jgi:hypothetical protein